MPRLRMSPEVKARLVASAPSVAVEAERVLGQAYVVEQVRRWIFDGVLRDGDVISQDDLADVLRVSRIPVRDGLIALAGSGWVVMEAGVGARAAGLDRSSVRDSLDLLGHVWTLLIRRGVERGRDTTALLAAAAEVRVARDADAMTTANDRFVRELRALAGSVRLDAAFANAGRIVPGDFFWVVPDALAVQRRHVPAIARAIARGDHARASELAVAQHRAHARNIVRLLRDRGVLPD